MPNRRKKIYIAIALILIIYLVYKIYEIRPSDNWKEYRSLIGKWSRLKSEGIESIRFTSARSPLTGHDEDSSFEAIVEIISYRQRDPNIVKWWSQHREVPKECLPECIDVIDRGIKNTRRPWWLLGALPTIRPSERMLVVTKKGKYIFHVETNISTEYSPNVYGDDWVSYELGEYLKECGLRSTNYFVPPKEQTVVIALFSNRKRCVPWFGLPPVVLFGDKKPAEDLLYPSMIEAGKPAGRPAEPNMVFEGRDWLEKIVDAYEIVFKEAEEKNFRSNQHCDNYGWIVFVTQDWFYWKEICIGENAVYGYYYMPSEQLKAYFDELGITKDLLEVKPAAAEPNSETSGIYYINGVPVRLEKISVEPNI
ncbi:MAG: hypothetical protein JW749_04710 [Sedimentisphaerales bacterium]|nr:hypothetical protein [Sedimentisphaerales bacterium]